MIRTSVLSTFHCSSEVAPLKAVLTHRPDSGIGQVYPHIAEELLFDDIVDVDKMQQEHDVFTQILRLLIGSEGVLSMQDLIKESLDAAGEGKVVFLIRVGAFEELPDRFLEDLNRIPHDRLAEILITGHDRQERRTYFYPIPNFIFTRDLSPLRFNPYIFTLDWPSSSFHPLLFTRALSPFA